jgi:hypothetical protein
MLLMNHLDPNDWDFRGLDPGHYYAALEYELARENPHLPGALALLTPEWRREIEGLNEGDWDWNHKSHKPPWHEREGFKVEGERLWEFYAVLRACWYCVEFPKPWMALSAAQHATAVERCGEPYPPLRLLTREQLTRIEECERMLRKAVKHAEDEQVAPQQEPPVRRYIVEIDWERGDNARLKPLLLGLLKLRPYGIGPRKRHTGKRAAQPIHLFKQLAAWRVGVKAGMNYKEARRLLAERRREFSSDDPMDLLPDYKSAGAWKDAVDAGRKLVQRGW